MKKTNFLFIAMLGVTLANAATQEFLSENAQQKQVSINEMSLIGTVWEDRALESIFDPRMTFTFIDETNCYLIYSNVFHQDTIKLVYQKEKDEIKVQSSTNPNILFEFKLTSEFSFFDKNTGGNFSRTYETNIDDLKLKGGIWVGVFQSQLIIIHFTSENECEITAIGGGGETYTLKERYEKNNDILTIYTKNIKTKEFDKKIGTKYYIKDVNTIYQLGDSPDAEAKKQGAVAVVYKKAIGNSGKIVKK